MEDFACVSVQGANNKTCIQGQEPYLILMFVAKKKKEIIKFNSNAYILIVII